MNKQKEDLSALLDGEMDELGTRRILKALDEQPELLDDWEVYSFIGDSLRQSEVVSNHGTQGGQRALAEIAKLHEQTNQNNKDRQRPWASWAIAASVAALVLGVGSQFVQPVTQLASVALNRGSLMLADSRPADPVEMDRYVDLHREVAVPGLQRVSYVSADAVGGR